MTKEEQAKGKGKATLDNRLDDILRSTTSGIMRVVQNVGKGPKTQ